MDHHGKRQPYHIIRQPSTGSIRLGSTVRHRRYTLRIRFRKERWHCTSLLTFFRTTWFRIISCLCLILILYLIYMWRVQTLKQQKKELHRKVVSRTQKLKAQTDLLAQRTQTLEKQNELLSQQKAEILGMSKRIQNLTAEKLAFFHQHYT